MYKPEPIDTSHVQLPDDIDDLLDTLAEHNHDVWAQQRMKEGWTWGPQREDQNRKHPDLVSYALLPDFERAYDRLTASQVLTAILSLGYRIEGSAGAVAATNDPDATALIRELRDPATDMARLLVIWHKRSHPDSAWQPVAELYTEMARRLLSGAAPLLALEAVQEGLDQWPEHLLLQQLQGLALARVGATERARALLQKVADELRRRQTPDEHVLKETFGTLARTYKDLGLRTQQREERRHNLARACELYDEAYRQTGDYWNGINVATLATLLDEDQRAVEVARDVKQRCRHRLDLISADDDERYWILATIGEADLILKDWPQAGDWYRQAGQAARD